jgi:hypothetical protein
MYMPVRGYTNDRSSIRLPVPPFQVGPTLDVSPPSILMTNRGRAKKVRMKMASTESGARQSEECWLLVR